MQLDEFGLVDDVTNRRLRKHLLTPSFFRVTGVNLIELIQILLE